MSEKIHDKNVCPMIKPHITVHTIQIEFE